MKKSIKVLITVITVIAVTIMIIGIWYFMTKNNRLIADYLKGKYGENFTVIKVGNAFNGNDLRHKYAIAKSDSSEDEIYIYCYPNSKRKGDIIYIDGKEHVIVDDYAEIAFQNQMQNELKEKINNEVFLKCEIAFSDYTINNEEYEKGLEYCLNDELLKSNVTIYVVARNESELNKIRNIVEEYCNGYNAYMQYLYFAIAPSADEKTISKHYKKESSRFDSHLNECDEISRVEFTLIERNEGITEKSVEKE